MTDSKWFELSKAARQLPSPTGVVLRVLRLAEDETTSAAELARALQVDPALAGRVLKYANSAYVGAPRPFVALRDAVAHLGARCIRRLTQGFSLVSQYRSGASQRFNYQSYWSRSLAMALAAEKLSRATGQGNSDEIFMCALLSEVGALTLATVHPRAYDEVLARSEGLPRNEQLLLQRQAFTLDEVDVTCALMSDWGLPEAYIAAVRALGHPESLALGDGADCHRLACLLRGARLVARYCTAAESERPRHAEALRGMSAPLGIDTALLSRLCDEAVREWQEWGRIMEVPTQQVPSLKGMMDQDRPAQAAVEGSPTELHVPRGRVLLASADLASFRKLAQEIESAGYSVIAASDGSQALHLVLEVWPEIILLAPALGDMNALEFCRLLRKTRPGKQTYIILAGQWSNEEQVVAALDAGVDDFCPIPCNPRILAARLRSARGLVEMLRGLEEEQEETRQVAAGLALERRRLEEQLRQSQKMEAIGRLAGCIAHDFNNHLTIMSGYAQLLLARTPDGNPIRDMVQQVLLAAEQASGLTRQLLAFGRQSPVEPKALDLNSFVSNSEKLLRRILGEEIELTMQLAPGLGQVRIDQTCLTQVLLNLVINARDAMPSGGRLTITTGEGAPDGSPAQAPGAADGASPLMLAVSDTGCGMSEEVKAHIFEPFFTTKENGKGTGLGLATVSSIVKQAGGQISIDSAAGRGTTFCVYLPRARQESGPEKVVAPVAPLVQGHGVVLLAEDEDGVRALVAVALSAAGYQVIEASDGYEALDRAREHGGPIRLVIADVVMPRLGGRQLVEALRAWSPQTKALYMSGYTDDVLIQHGLKPADDAFLAKPFTLGCLTQKVREMLEAEER